VRRTGDTRRETDKNYHAARHLNVNCAIDSGWNTAGKVYPEARRGGDSRGDRRAGRDDE
jgi:hypothetical protein